MRLELVAEPLEKHLHPLAEQTEPLAHAAIIAGPAPVLGRSRGSGQQKRQKRNQGKPMSHPVSIGPRRGKMKRSVQIAISRLTGKWSEAVSKASRSSGMR
ncbi:hypothetical protein NHU_01855 [Rhodovulum sulfidophilum]|uniref:Uncharacterized protein n=1 Tax=Rhodovulum sulfidophilum TaxID=35806 RepID=A0A0D6B298_RHOSU|nr:hypothetical protein NHU_01855 [Rhodovulum sulfidophilum]